MFRLVKKLSRAEAFAALMSSPWIKKKVAVDTSRSSEFLENRAWAITDVNRDLGKIGVVSNFNGRYSLHEAPLSRFIDVLRETIDTYSALRHIYYDLTTPHEYAS